MIIRNMNALTAPLTPAPSTPANAADVADGAATLPHMGVIRAQGADAVKFLHGQLSNDVSLQGLSEARLAAFCSPKGRMLASFVYFKLAADDVLLVCSRDLLQTVLKRLPARLAARVLLKAMSRHAWTFAGSGSFHADAGSWGRPVVLRIQHNPLCVGLNSEAPACDYYAATFERLFQVLVHGRSVVHEVACEACGDSECRFEIRWS